MSPLETGALETQHEELFQALLFRVVLRDGTVLRYTNLDLDVPTHDVGFGAEGFSAAAGIRLGPLTAGIDLQIDATWIRVANRPLTLGAVTMPVAHWAKVRKFNGADVQVYLYDEKRAASAAHSFWTVQDTHASMTEVEFSLESFAAKLDRAIPRIVFQPSCNHALGDTFCGVNLDPLYRVTSTVVAGTTTSVEYGTLTPSTPPAPAVAYADGWFSKGEIEFTSGNLIGLRETLLSHAGSTVAPIVPFPEAPDIGSTIRLWAGCLKRYSEDCLGKFGTNRVAAPLEPRRRFLGFPYALETEKTIGFGGRGTGSIGG